MPVAWTLEYDGQVRPLKNWGITRARTTYRSLDADSFSFTAKRESVLADPAFPYGADVILRRDDVGWFRGKVMQAGAVAAAKSEGDSYVAANAWASLSRLPYQQMWCIGGAPQLTPRVTLGQNTFGQKISVGRQISEIITYALSKGLIVAPGLLPEFLECWLEEERDITCAGAIRKMLRLCPQAVSWCDYSAGGTPTFNVQENNLIAAVTLDATAADRIIDFDLRPRNDLVPPGVTFIYTSTARDEEESAGDGRLYTTVTRDTAGVTDVEGSIVAMVELNSDETAPAGAALAYWSALQVTPWQGSISLKEQHCTGDLRPGKVVNVSNGRAAWATMRAVVQAVTEDLFTGETTADLGPPEHLAPQDFIEQQQVARRRPKPSKFPNVQMCSIPDPEADPGDPEDGTPPEATIPNPDAGVDPDAKDAEDKAKNLPRTSEFRSEQGSVDITFCQDGEDVCARVVGTIITCA